MVYQGGGFWKVPRGIAPTNPVFPNPAAGTDEGVHQPKNRKALETWWGFEARPSYLPMAFSIFQNEQNV